MSLRIKVLGVQELRADLEKISKNLVTPQLLGALALDAKAVILKRTNKGQDYKRKSFKPYSPRYKAVRRKRGRRVNKVDLQMRRHMLADMHTTTNLPRRQAFITFRRTEEKKKAIHHHITGAGVNRIKREFFGLGPKDISGLEERVSRHIKKIINI